MIGLIGVFVGLAWDSFWNNNPYLSVVFRFFWQSFFLFLVVTAVGAPLGVVINEIHYHPKDKNSASEFIELFNSSGQEVDLHGWQIDLGVRFTFPSGAKILPEGFVVVAKSPEGLKATFGKEAIGAWKGKLKHGGEALLLKDAKGGVIDQVNFGTGFPWPTAADGEGASLELIHPAMDHLAGSSWRSSGFVVGKNTVGKPTPGERNSTAVVAPLPSITAIGHAPVQPKPGEAVRVGARVVAAAGVKSVTLDYQVVDPGKYIRKSDPAFEKDWTSLPMRDDGKDGDVRGGDAVYSVLLPGKLQQNRRLIRYRISAEDARGQSIRVPYSDDDCPNFSYFCFGGFSPWAGFAGKPSEGVAVVFANSLFATLPSLTLLAAQEDVENSQWDGAANKKDFTGTMVSGGKVYDHVTFSNRGQGSATVSGKNKWGFKFNPSRDFEMPAKGNDRHPRTVNSLSMNACASPWVHSNRGMAGLDEAVAFRSYEVAGVPSPQCRYVQFRVIDGVEEAAKDGVSGDLWGLYQLIENPDGSFLKERDLPDGNIYRMAGAPEKKHQGVGQPKDHADYDGWIGPVRGGADENWWRANVNLPVYYSFHAINRLVGNVDLRPSENHFLYHGEKNRWLPIPWDLDMVFIPKTHQPGFMELSRCLEVPALRLEYRNRCREILDLFCDDPTPRGGQFGQLIDEFLLILHPPGQRLGWPELDQYIWNYHPRTVDKGAFYRNPDKQTMAGGDFLRTLATPDFGGFVKYITDYVTALRPADAPWKLNDGIAAGYGYGYLLAESESAEIPERPKISFTGLANYPANALAFTSTPFASKKAGAQFAAIQWRLGEITAPVQIGARRHYELQPIWESAELSPFQPGLRLPVNLAQVGSTYRVRVRLKDNAGRFSRWSEPITFTATAPVGATAK